MYSPSPRSPRCWDWSCWGCSSDAMRRRIAANFQGNFWHNAGLGAQHAVQVGVGGPTVSGGNADHPCRGAGGIAFFRRCLEQRDFHRRRSEESQPQSAAVAGDGNGRGDRALHRLQLYLSEHSAAGWQSGRRDHSGTRHQVCHRRPRGHRGHDPDVRAPPAER